MPRFRSLHQGGSIHPRSLRCHERFQTMERYRWIKLFTIRIFSKIFVFINIQINFASRSNVTYGINLARAYTEDKNAHGLEISNLRRAADSEHECGDQCVSHTLPDTLKVSEPLCGKPGPVFSLRKCIAGKKDRVGCKEHSNLPEGRLSMARAPSAGRRRALRGVCTALKDRSNPELESIMEAPI
jgi:hypothetical protein